ncbi:hypothetical protein [Meiothermus sp. Pnk-1]|uniref:hypothetical protein n=1 Tax=Meiothermus sp. Pnk-1 TaxID=873128 RepID=UPI000D7C5B30|nr:hypothetical protein [Meiothermus sp. Pnk-1]PZA05893.1 hypothetical protein DNA98_16220 [Meiothermus sp. Pnk-1]
MDIEQQVLEALSSYVSRGAALNLLQRAIKAGGRPPLSPEDWARVIEGPLMRELTQVLPVRGVLPPFKAILAKLRSSPTPPPAPVPSPDEEPEAPPPLEQIPLSDPVARQGLVQNLARLEGVVGVILETPYGREVRAPGLGPEFARMVGTAHRLIVTRGSYSMFYTVLESAQLLIRPMRVGWIAVLARGEANLGALMYRLRYIEGLQEVEHPS